MKSFKIFSIFILLSVSGSMLGIGGPLRHSIRQLPQASLRKSTPTRPYMTSHKAPITTLRPSRNITRLRRAPRNITRLLRAQRKLLEQSKSEQSNRALTPIATPTPSCMTRVRSGMARFRSWLRIAILSQLGIGLALANEKSTNIEEFSSNTTRWISDLTFKEYKLLSPEYKEFVAKQEQAAAAEKTKDEQEQAKEQLIKMSASKVLTLVTSLAQKTQKTFGSLLR